VSNTEDGFAFGAGVSSKIADTICHWSTRSTDLLDIGRDDGIRLGYSQSGI
jgi:hypothetical protein